MLVQLIIHLFIQQTLFFPSYTGYWTSKPNAIRCLPCIEGNTGENIEFNSVMRKIHRGCIREQWNHCIFGFFLVFFLGSMMTRYSSTKWLFFRAASTSCRHPVCPKHDIYFLTLFLLISSSIFLSGCLHSGNPSSLRV